MRSQINSGTITSTGHTTASADAQLYSRIPRHEQDDDLWRYAVPGRDPVTQMRGPDGRVS